MKMSRGGNSLAEKLPIEIVANILQNLSSFDRKSARLVNLKWYQASRELVIQKKEKFLLDGLSVKNQLKSVFETLQNGGYRYYNLEFNNVDFRFNLYEFMTFLESNSSYIHSLKFVRCSLPFFIIEKIMMNCVNLETLIFKSCDCFIHFNKTLLLRNSERKIIRKNLKYLELNSGDWITDHVLELFIDIYPNIKTLRYSSGEMKLTLNFLNSLENSNLLFLNENVAECINDRFFVKLLSFPWIKLKELRINDEDYENVRHNQEDFQVFLPVQNDLKSLNMYSCARFEIVSLETVLLLFPNLERLKFWVDYNIAFLINEPVTKKVLELLATSKLKVLEIHSLQWFESDLIFPKNCQNGSLYYLDLHSCWHDGAKRITDTFLNSLLETFCCLTYLDLSKTEIQDFKKQTAKIIFQNQTKLKYLKLNKCRWISDYTFEKSNLPILEHLELINNSRITDDAIRNFGFPKLKFLRLRRCWRISDKGFTLLPQKCPLVRHLDLSGTRINENSILNVCKNLKFLHCLNIAKRRNPLLLNFQIISEYCSSLRFIQIRRTQKTQKTDVYFYNYLQKLWNKSAEIDFKCIRCQLSRREVMNLNL